MNKLSSNEEQLIYYITYISDNTHETNRENWQNEYASMHSLIRLDNINRLCYELLEKYKNEELLITWDSYNKLFSTVKQFVDHLRGRGTPLKDAYGLGELFVYMSMNINMTEKDNREVSDIDFNETLYLKAKELAGINDPWFLYQEPQDAQATLDGVTSALKYTKQLEMIYAGTMDNSPSYSEVAERALGELTKTTAHRKVNSYPFISAYIDLVNITYYSRRLKETDIQSVIHELELMQTRLNEYLSSQAREVYVDSLPATVPSSEPTRPDIDHKAPKSAGISLDFFKKD
ncbi:MAG: hypothetical protein ABS904_00730 [Solibacillus isronensis]